MADEQRETQGIEKKANDGKEHDSKCPEALKNLKIFQKKLKKGVDKGGEIWYSLQARSRGGAGRGPVRERPNLENDTEEKRARRKTAKIPKSFAGKRKRPRGSGSGTVKD